MHSISLRRSLPLLPLSLGLVLILPSHRHALADLDSYVKAPDASYGWKAAGELDLPGSGKAHILRLTSQTWRDIPWEHWLTVIRPEKIARAEHALLVITGGSTRSKKPEKLSGEAMILSRVAQSTGSVVAVLQQVPNQPLFDNLSEDALISYTFEKYVKTGEETWPCLLPMVKSAVRAMDAVQAFGKDKLAQEIRRFVVTGASKRGWTTWLTGAVDPRVIAIAPMVIDVLNMPKQMPHQVLSFGHYSEQIADYTERGLPDLLQTPAAKKLIEVVDPYSYRSRLTLPKLILLGTNDRYWPVDAVKMYFGDLGGEKNIHYVPNKGHGLGPGAAEAVTAFYDLVTQGKALPRFKWSFSTGEKEAMLSVETQDKPLKVELWQAGAPTRDFRDATWSASPLENDGVAKEGEVQRSQGGRYVAKVPVPEKGFAALFAQLTFKSALGIEYALSTNVEVVGR